MARIAGKVAENADKAVRVAALACDQAVVVSTPVDTGRARANWIPSLDVASEAEIDEPSSPEAGTQSALNAGQAVAGAYDGDKHSAIHITNNLPYIQPLNDGWSAQAPAGFVQTAVQAGAAAAKTVRILNDD